MGTFLLLIFIFFLVFYVVIPLLRVGRQIWRAYSSISNTKRTMRDAFNQATGGASQYDTNPYPKKKKIDSTVGEYVPYEEIRDPKATPHQAPHTTPSEPQIEDADWEDIK